jgi:hypothetical protein
MVGMRPPRRLPVRTPGSASFSRSPRLIRTSTASRTLDLRLRRGHGRPQQGQVVGGASAPIAGGVPQQRARHARQKLCSHARSTGSSKGPPHSGHVASCSRRSTSPGPSSGASMGSQGLGATPSATTATACESADGGSPLLLADSMPLSLSPALTFCRFSARLLGLALSSTSLSLGEPPHHVRLYREGGGSCRR